ncbi:GTA head formation protein, RCAP_rcc01685 family [Tropicibacter sp. S64]|uniref:GTA head formation protein, RCAP_rcc01685 family n=1 Tax=Tropicibacter sp. S64 TaxID=3415122 RepID=UPI003C7C8CAB
MSERRTSEPFACAPALRLEAHEQISKLHVEAMTTRYEHLEKQLERVEKRVWLTVYGVAGAILLQVFAGFMTATP